MPNLRAPHPSLRCPGATQVFLAGVQMLSRLVDADGLADEAMDALLRMQGLEVCTAPLRAGDACAEDARAAVVSILHRATAYPNTHHAPAAVAAGAIQLAVKTLTEQTPDNKRVQVAPGRTRLPFPGLAWLVRKAEAESESLRVVVYRMRRC